MTPRGFHRAIAACAALAAAWLGGCERDTSNLKPVPLSTEPTVFTDALAEGVDYQAFMNSKYDAITVVTNEKYSGTSSLRVTVPAAGDPTGWFAGGAFTSSDWRDLSGYNALVFYAKSSRNGALLNVAGLGNDNTGTSQYEASCTNLVMSTEWKRFVIPIPLPSKLSQERGLFYFAEGAENNEGYEFFFDDVMFANLASVSNPRPVLETKTISGFAGATVDPGNAKTTFSVGGVDQVVDHMPGYFSYASSDPNVVKVTNGVIKLVGEGEATVTATLGTVAATGVITVKGTAAPTTAAPTPTLPASDVISLFSNAYTNVTVDTWWAEWSHNYSTFTEFKVAGDDVKAYSNLTYAGIEFTSHLVNANAMTHFHMDVWVPVPAVPNSQVFKVKLVDFGEDGQYQGAPDSERELTYWYQSTPPLTAGEWVSLDIPLEDFMNGPSGLFDRAHLAQLIVSGTGNTLFLDNVYFHK
ncbi:MAG TPA: hypothetical protein VF247_07420 [Candidatus Krumholzibacteria bacterium]